MVVSCRFVFMRFFPLMDSHATFSIEFGMNGRHAEDKEPITNDCWKTFIRQHSSEMNCYISFLHRFIGNIIQIQQMEYTSTHKPLIDNNIFKLFLILNPFQFAFNRIDAALLLLVHCTQYSVQYTLVNYQS